VSPESVGLFVPLELEEPPQLAIDPRNKKQISTIIGFRIFSTPFRLEVELKSI
jgi:hypothetical protein